jgi:hypothetical protein
MEYIRKIPFILGAAMAIAIGLISLNCNIDTKQVYIRMILSLLAFFVLGVLLRSTLIEINKEITLKKEIEEEKEEELKNSEKESMGKESPAVADPNTPAVDYQADDYSEDFTPLKIKEIINMKDQ